jgi:hypothetical protein
MRREGERAVRFSSERPEGKLSKAQNFCLFMQLSFNCRENCSDWGVSNNEPFLIDFSRFPPPVDNIPQLLQNALAFQRTFRTAFKIDIQ